MFVKKIFFWSVLAAPLVACAVYGEPVINTEHSTNQSEKNTYEEVNLGYARQNYFNNANWNAFPPAFPGVGTNFSNNANVNGGFTVGLDVGRQLNKYFAVELGWFQLPDVNVMQTGTTPAYLTSYAIYLAAKYMVPIRWMNDTNLYYKLGAAYRQATLPAAALASAGGYMTSVSTANLVRPMFAIGLNYHFNKSYMAAIQYSYFMGANNAFPLLTPNAGSLGLPGANIFTFGLGYRFST